MAANIIKNIFRICLSLIKIKIKIVFAAQLLSSTHDTKLYNQKQTRFDIDISNYKYLAGIKILISVSLY
jgi:hypothetical protein